MNNNTKKTDALEQLPLLPLRGMLTYPNMVLRIDVGRDKSMEALRRAMEGDQLLLVVAQRDSGQDDPHLEDVYGVGTVVKVKQAVQMPDETVRVLIEGQSRALLVDILEQGSMQLGLVKRFESSCRTDDLELMAHLRVLKRLARSFMQQRGMHNSTELMQAVDGSEDPDGLCDALAQNLLTSLKDKQRILECRDVLERIQELCRILSREVQLQQLEQSIHDQVHQTLDKHQREYYLHEQLKAIHEELGDEDEQEKRQFEARLAESKMNGAAREKVMQELKRMSRAGNSPDGAVSRTYVEYLLDFPWGVRTQDQLSLKRARQVLDQDHFGLEKVKQRIIEFLAVGGLKGSLSGPILCLVGPPGVGKTSIAQSVARALHRKFVRLSLGGLRDEAEIRGHRRTYIGAIPGRIVSGIKSAGSENPVFLLDEIDKMTQDFRGDPASAMLEVLDPAQNASFSDHYLEAPFDLSQVLFITTANSPEGIPAPLRDRMELIPIEGYTSYEKAEIARRHLWPKLLKAHGLKPSQLRISKSAVMALIEGYTREAGVRTLERELGAIIRKAAIRLLETPDEERAPITIGARQLSEYLGTVRFLREPPERQPETGLVNGLACTSVGGETLSIEAICMPGNGKLDLTGQLGDVMQESARAALSYIRSRSDALSIAPDFYQKHDLHVHLPEGAIPKDGPSAGVALTCAMVSAITGKPARQDIAMTGEVTLRGRVLPIGGVKEKLLAAHRMGIHDVLLPIENEKDLADLPVDIRGSMNVKLIRRVDQALGEVLGV